MGCQQKGLPRAKQRAFEEIKNILDIDVAEVKAKSTRGRQRGDRDPVSRTNFNKIHASRFESVIVGETSGNEIFTTKHK